MPHRNGDAWLQVNFMEDKKQKVFDKYWFKKHQSKILWVANSWFGKYIFGFNKYGHKLDYSKKISQVSPNSVHQFNGAVWSSKNKRIEHEHTGHFFSTNVYARRLYFILLPIWWSMHIWDWFVADYFELAPQLSFGFSTLTVNPVAGSFTSGNVSTDLGSVSFSTLRSDAGSNSSTGTPIRLVDLDSTITSNQFSRMYRTITCFDTSSLGSSATISAAVLSYASNGTSGSNTFSASGNVGIVGATPASTTTLVNGDYAQLGTTRYATDIDVSTLSTTNNTYNDWTFNATGRSNISLTGASKFGVRLAWDIDNSAPTWGSNKSCQVNAYNMLGGDFPKLVVTYTAPVAPTVTTSVATSIGSTTATGNGNVTSDGGATVTERGIVWGTSANPTTANNKVTSGSGTGSFSASLTGLPVNTTIHDRAYAINSVGTSYGSDDSFVTLSASGNMFLVM